MYSYESDDLLWSSFFNLDDVRKKELVAQIKDITSQNFSEQVVHYIDIKGLKPHDECYAKACEVAVLEYCLTGSHFARDFMSDEDYDKVLNQFKRKQYSSNLSKDLLAKFTYLLRKVTYDNRYAQDYSHSHYHAEQLSLLLRQTIGQICGALWEEKTIKSFGELRKAMEIIASGVKNDCYFAAEKGISHRNIIVADELNDFLVKQYEYNLNKFNWWEIEQCEKEYKRALLDSEEFWNAHENFKIFTFLDSIYKLNGVKHAQKVLTHMFDNIKNDTIGAKLIENNLSLLFLDKQSLFERVTLGTFNMLFMRFESMYDLARIRHEVLCYPFVGAQGIRKRIAEGKQIFDSFFNTVYAEESSRLISFFNEQLDGKGEPYHLSYGFTVRDLFVRFSFRFWDIIRGEHEAEYKAMEVYCADYFSTDNLWNRIYLIAYATLSLAGDKERCYACLAEIFSELFNIVELKFGLKTSFQRDTVGRDKAYGELKQLLETYDLSINDQFKQDYIISLLDRKVANMEEIARFPALEQLGDAVYGFAVAEMMFYQPEEMEEDSILKYFAQYITAEKQVEIAQMLGLDNLYISSLSLLYKYTRDTLVNPDTEKFHLKEEITNYKTKYKYLADSLEMVIGTVCMDCGYQAAINFTKSIVKKCFPDVFKGEIRWENRDEVNKSSMEIDGDYWIRIKPSPLVNRDQFNFYCSIDHLETMWDAFNKFMLAYSLGTEDVEKRDFITHRYSHRETGDELYGKRALGRYQINYAMYDYLHCGLAYAVDKYSARIIENYIIIEKKS